MSKTKRYKIELTLTEIRLLRDLLRNEIILRERQVYSRVFNLYNKLNIFEFDKSLENNICQKK